MLKPVLAGTHLECGSYYLSEESKSVSPDVRNKIPSTSKARRRENGREDTEELCRGRTGSDPLQGLKVKEHGLLKERKAAVRQAVC